MNTRSNRAEVRNPVLLLPAFRLLLDHPSSQHIASILHELQVDARDRADKCWSKHKAPMAAYWKAVAVYAGHLARALQKANRAMAQNPAEPSRIDAIDSAIRIGIFNTCIERGLDQDAAIAIVKGTMAQLCVAAALAKRKAQ